MNLQSWIPAHLAQPREVAWHVEWLRMGEQRFEEPFFEETMMRLSRSPFHQLFRRRTTVKDLLAWSNAHTGVPLRGLIFHMSRCGSTLLSRMLAASPRHLVLSEPAPLDAAVRARQVLPSLAAEDHCRLLQGMMTALTQPRSGEELASFVKLDAWDVHEFAAIREAFPETPFLFLYRDPVEVMVSHQRMPGAWTVPGMMDPRALRMQPEDWNPARQEIYLARSLASICEAGLRAVRLYGGMLMNYTELPAFDRIARHFQLIEDDGADTLPALQQNAKSPSEGFQPDAEQKRREASDAVREAADRYVAPVFEELEALRLQQCNFSRETERAAIG